MKFPHGDGVSRESRLGVVLRQVEGEYRQGFLHTDPVEFPRRYRNRLDREAAAFLTAGLSYGAVPQIRRSVSNLLERLGPGLSATLRNSSQAALTRRLRGFVHRWSRGPDVAGVAGTVGKIQRRWVSLENFFREGDPGGEDLIQAASSFSRRAFALAGPKAGRGVEWFFPDPGRGSASKRLFLFLRWMVRPDDGVDLGVWKSLSPSRLIIPLDTHLYRIGWGLRLTRRKTPDLEAALEITRNLRTLDPQDPTRFDFALCRLGILNRCSGRAGKAFRKTCPLYGLCRHR